MAWPETGCVENSGPRAQCQGAEDGCGLLSAGCHMRLFRGKSLQEIQEITFEIGMLGRYGLDINDPTETHVRGCCRGCFPFAGMSPLLSTFLLFYFQWRSESDGSISSMTL